MQPWHRRGFGLYLKALGDLKQARYILFSCRIGRTNLAPSQQELLCASFHLATRSSDAPWLAFKLAEALKGQNEEPNSYPEGDLAGDIHQDHSHLLVLLVSAFNFLKEDFRQTYFKAMDLIAFLQKKTKVV